MERGGERGGEGRGEGERGGGERGEEGEERGGRRGRREGGMLIIQWLINTITGTHLINYMISFSMKSQLDIHVAIQCRLTGTIECEPPRQLA